MALDVLITQVHLWTSWSLGMVLVINSVFVLSLCYEWILMKIKFWWFPNFQDLHKQLGPVPQPKGAGKLPFNPR